MRQRKHDYRTMEDLYLEREGVSWYWKVMSVASSWLILGGYLLLPTTFNTEASLRYSKGILSILIVAFLTGGYSLTALLCFACRSLLFRHENIFFPAFSSSCIGLLASLFCLSSSRHYSFKSTSAPITLGLACASIILYGILFLFSHRRIKQIRRMQNAANNGRNYGVTNGMWQDPSYYSNFIANMHPTVRQPSPTESIPLPFLTEDELVNQQMAMLLMKQDPGPSPDASQNTFHIDLPNGADRDEIQDGRRATLGPGNVRVNDGRNRATTDNRGDGRAGAWGRFATVMERGRTEVRQEAQPRAVSREERRREIELGQL